MIEKNKIFLLAVGRNHDYITYYPISLGGIGLFGAESNLGLLFLKMNRNNSKRGDWDPKMKLN